MAGRNENVVGKERNNPRGAMKNEVSRNEIDTREE